MKADNLTRVVLKIRTSESGQLASATPAGKELAFIFGISRDGLCPLEAQLQHRSAGDMISQSVNGSTAPEYFGHLYPLVCGILDLPEAQEAVELEFSVVDISQPDSRQIVKAMARSVGHGCGGDDCDCGCS